MQKSHPNKYNRNRKVRQEEAAKRQAEYDKLTPEQKLSKLTKHNLTAMKERAKLQKQIEASKAKKVEEVAPKAQEATSEAEKAAVKAKKADKEKAKKAKKDKIKAA